MGCIWSNEENDHCTRCSRQGVNNLVIIDHVCEICIRDATNTSYSPAGPKYGEYRCSYCRRYWNSRWCWPDKFQMCKQCKTPTLPFNYRDIKPTDITNSTEIEKEHVRALCQMCQQLGYFCKDFSKRRQPPALKNQRTIRMSSRTNFR